jgi:hypothetical protein
MVSIYWKMLEALREREKIKKNKLGLSSAKLR